MRHKDVPVMYDSIPVKTTVTREIRGIGTVSEVRTVGFRTAPMVDIPELFRHTPIALEKYQERVRGIEARLGRVLEKRQ